MSDVFNTIWRAMNFQLFELGGNEISVMTIVTVVGIMVGAAILSRITRNGIKRASEMRGIKDEGSVGVINYVVNVIFLVVGFGVAVEAIGFDLAALFTAGAAFAVAIGLAVQGVIQNFVSGAILLGERTIKPGDVLELDGNPVKVTRITMRSTVVRTLDDEDIIVPNNNLVQASVKNYTFSDGIYRLRAPVGVVYSSDMDEVQQTLEEAAASIEWRIEKREPVVLLTGFGSSSVDFEVSVWIDDAWKIRRRRSDLNHIIWKALKAKNIVIAFPQVDVHFDPPINDSIKTMGRPKTAA